MKIPPILTRPEFVCNKLLFVINFSTQKCDKYPVFKTQLLKFTPGTSGKYYTSEGSSGATIAITYSSLKLKMSISTLRKSFNKVTRCQANSSLKLIFWIVWELFIRQKCSLFLFFKNQSYKDRGLMRHQSQKWISIWSFWTN